MAMKSQLPIGVIHNGVIGVNGIGLGGFVPELHGRGIGKRCPNRAGGHFKTADAVAITVAEVNVNGGFKPVGNLCADIGACGKAFVA